MRTIVQSVVFGTADDCDVRVMDDRVSPYHCRISELADGRVVVEDLGSTHGTWVRLAGVSWNRATKVFGPTRIYPGIVLRIGRTDIPWEAT